MSSLLQLAFFRESCCAGQSQMSEICSQIWLQLFPTFNLWQRAARTAWMISWSWNIWEISRTNNRDQLICANQVFFSYLTIPSTRSLLLLLQDHEVQSKLLISLAMLASSCGILLSLHPSSRPFGRLKTQNKSWLYDYSTHQLTSNV